jgi:hypothetical protein
MKNEDFTDFIFKALGRVIIMGAFIFGAACVYGILRQLV